MAGAAALRARSWAVARAASAASVSTGVDGAAVQDGSGFGCRFGHGEGEFGGGHRDSNQIIQPRAIIGIGLNVSGAAAPRCAARGKSGQMSSVTEEDGMPKHASQAGDALTTDRTSARRPGYRGESLRQAPSLDGRAEASDRGRRHAAGGVGAMVARKHGISSGQFYAWRQQLLLRGTLGANRHPAEYGGRRCGAERAAAGARHSCTTGGGPPTTAAAPVPPVQPNDQVGVTRRDGVEQHGGPRLAALSPLERPIVGAGSAAHAPHEQIAVRSTDR